MSHYTNMKLNNDFVQDTLLQEKVEILADEVLIIMKELHEEHRSLVNSKQIVKKMFSKESIKNLLGNSRENDTDYDSNVDNVKQSINDLFNRFSDLVPISMKEHLATLRIKYSSSTSKDVLNDTDKIIKTILETIVYRVDELENILHKTTYFLYEMDSFLKNETNLFDKSHQESTTLMSSICSDSRAIKDSFDMSSDIITIKKIVSSKIANITRTIEEKRKQDIFRLNKTKTALETMSNKMSDIVNEAETIRKRSLETDIESFQDTLTKLYNRKALDKKIEETLADLRRYHISSSLLICDIDQFKEINDNYGHRTGDLTLKKIAQVFKQRIRKNDFVARYDGGEFVFILPHTSLKESKEISEHIRSNIERTTFTYKNNEISLTISFGISTFKEEDNAYTVFDRADASLYLAKKSGRNMVKTENDLESSAINYDE